jgi:hypothetical protein
MTKKTGLIIRLKTWYRGVYVPPPENKPGSGVVFIGLGFYVQPPLARLIKRAIEFWLKHWQWIIGTVLAVIGILVSMK